MTRRTFLQLGAWVAAALCIRSARAAGPPTDFEFPLRFEGAPAAVYPRRYVLHLPFVGR